MKRALLSTSLLLIVLHSGSAAAKQMSEKQVIQLADALVYVLTIENMVNLSGDYCAKHHPDNQTQLRLHTKKWRNSNAHVLKRSWQLLDSVSAAIVAHDNKGTATQIRGELVRAINNQVSKRMQQLETSPDGQARTFCIAFTHKMASGSLDIKQSNKPFYRLIMVTYKDY